MSVLVAIAKAGGLIVAVMIAWVAVDRAWRRMFPDRKSGCAGCAGQMNCKRDCRNQQDQH